MQNCRNHPAVNREAHSPSKATTLAPLPATFRDIPGLAARPLPSAVMSATPPPPAAAVTIERRLSLRVVTLPRDTNQYGTIFGGVILSYIDQAGFVEARRHGVHRWVTAAIDRVEFKAPVHVGDVVNFYARALRIGTKSVTVQVEVEAERYNSGQCVPVTEAQLVMVSVDAAGTPIALASPPTV